MRRRTALADFVAGKRLRRFVRTSLLLTAMLPICAAQAQFCAPVAIPNHYGPFDYNVEKGGGLQQVERVHFTPAVEALLRGSSGYLGGDLSYTLNAFPNHHRALASIMRWGATTRNPQPPHLQFSIDCYFDRATRFRPRDTVVRSLYAMHLAQNNRKADAMKQLQYAREVASESAISLHNIGLVYFELKEYEPAREAARAAVALGFPSVPLVTRLKSVGQWDDAREAATAAASAASAQPAPR
jgi:tetratricopeptide (TPR) repeat protein